eukprot:scaffold240446_cov30-Cyclotella_meneghiniana.AAC.1
MMINRLSLFKLAILSIQFSTIVASPESRRILQPTDNIGQIIRSQRSSNGKGFSISAEKQDGSGDLNFDVIEPAITGVTSKTIIKTKQEGSTASQPLGEDILYTLLVSDTSTSEGADVFALLAVDSQDNVHGIVDTKNGKPYKVKQNKGKKATAEEDETIEETHDWA